MIRYVIIRTAVREFILWKQKNGMKNRNLFLTVGAIALGLLLLAVVFCKDRNVTDGKEKTAGSWKVFQMQNETDGLLVRIVGENYMRMDAPIVTVDSEESENTTVAMLYDGIYDDKQLRWSSENDWEDNEHWVEVEFADTIPVGCIRLYWERANAISYAIELSDDGEDWQTAAAFDRAPESNCQDIILEEVAEAKYMRLHVFDVKKEEEDASLYYQNVSLLEMEVYGGITDEFIIELPKIDDASQRILQTPSVPENYELVFAGADYENVIDENGLVADTLSDVNVEIGYRLGKDGRWEELPAMPVTVPGNREVIEGNQETEGESVALPEDFQVMEWQPVGGSFGLADECKIYVDKDTQLSKSAGIFAKELGTLLKQEVSVVEVEDGGQLKAEESKGHIFIRYCEEIAAEEGYRMSLGTVYEDMVVIEGRTLQGLRWGMVSLLDLLNESERLPRGMVQDYPRYRVRGFGIDVARRAIGLDMLYRMTEEMSKQKMNTLLIHLNDNQIIAQSEHGGTLEGVRSLYSAFRLESDIVGENGVALTSSDLFYTKEEFKKFVEYAALLGVEVVPEIDTPAHSLAIIKVFPETGKTDDIFVADQLDLSKEKTKEVVKEIWNEYLESENGGESVFADCETVHIGMDEYFGDGAEFMDYIAEIYDHIKELDPEKKIRMWGSLTGKNCDYSQIARDIEMQVWSTDWADPVEMYEAGFFIINSQNNHLYIIPGSGYDQLDVEYLANNWQPNVFENENNRWEIPTYSKQMSGACYMMWNDMIMIDGIEITEEDLYERFHEPLAVISEKLWR